jgi:hypothetical protein
LHNYLAVFNGHGLLDLRPGRPIAGYHDARPVTCDEVTRNFDRIWRF